MHYRHLGRSGLKVSPICLGTMPIQPSECVVAILFSCFVSFSTIHSIAVRDRQFLGREERDHLTALVGDDHFLLDARGRKTVGCRAIGFQREHHAMREAAA